MTTSPSFALNNIILPHGWHVCSEVCDKLPTETLVPKQVHCGTIVEAQKLASARCEADGVLAGVSDAPIAVQTADCLPLVIVSRDKALALHVSRKTITRGLLDKASDLIAPASIAAVYIGPHICIRHLSFETEGPEVNLFKLLFPTAVDQHNGVTHLSLKRAVAAYLTAWRVPPEKIVDHSYCTFEHAELPSYRRSGQHTYPQLLTTVRKM